MRQSQGIYINIDKLTKVYRKNTGIHDMTLRFESGHLNLLIGPNGSGKTTLFKCIMGLVRYSGKIDRIPGRIGYAPEQYIMPTFMKAKEFLALIGRVKRESQDRIVKFINDFMEGFELLDVIDKPIGQLSKGSKQKINLLQAMINNPRILLLDEPLSGLDIRARDEAVKLFSAFSKDNLVIVSTHYPEYFRARNRRVYEIHEGRLVEDGPA